jgi:hypothetical protein
VPCTQNGEAQIMGSTRRNMDFKAGIEARLGCVRLSEAD